MKIEEVDDSFILHRNRYNPVKYVSFLWPWFKQHRDKVRAMKEKKKEMAKIEQKKKEEIAKIKKEIEEILNQYRSVMWRLALYAYNRVDNSPSTDEQDKEALADAIRMDLCFFEKNMTSEIFNIEGAIQELYK